MTSIAPNKTRKLLFQFVLGGIVGFIVGYLGINLPAIDNSNADQIIVSGIGLVYLLIGLIGSIGLIAPKLGAIFLNVEDADEIREQHRILQGSAICMIALGVALMVLPMAGPDGSLSPLVGFGGLTAALLVLTIISIRDWKYYDEMLMQLSRDAGNIGFCGIGGTLLIWAAAAWSGLVTGPTPLELVASISGGFLLSIFIASARKGLLKPR